MVLMDGVQRMENNESKSHNLYSTTRLYKIQRLNLPGFKNLAGLYRVISTITKITVQTIPPSPKPPVQIPLPPH